MNQKNVVVVGYESSPAFSFFRSVSAGVAGSYRVTIVAKHMPGDYDIEYASPWAGANYFPMSSAGTAAESWERNTWPALSNLAKNHPEAGIHFQRAEVYTRKKDAGNASPGFTAGVHSKNPWWASVLPNVKDLPADRLEDDIAYAKSFTSVCINTAIYLPWLVSQCLKNGVTLKRAALKHVGDAAQSGVHRSGKPADLIVNCTGLGSLKLGGVEDKLMYPARGQTVLIRQEADAMYGISSTDDADDEVPYIMTRAAGGGTILGGCYQKGSWESQPDPNMAIRIMKRSVAICPALTGGQGIEKLDVVRHNVGLRPAREGGIRLAREKIDGVHVVHNYGAGGSGYQTSYGCAEDVVKLVNEAFADRARL